MEKPERDKILQKIKEIEGSSLRQIARITGLTAKIKPEGGRHQKRPPDCFVCFAEYLAEDDIVRFERFRAGVKMALNVAWQVNGREKP
ncbi:MAG: hypothetical protein HPY74_20495 [Firmicutes bacterium]|nr:hypothetical protein [Bacillota bacterium]